MPSSHVIRPTNASYHITFTIITVIQLLLNGGRHTQTASSGENHIQHTFFPAQNNTQQRKKRIPDHQSVTTTTPREMTRALTPTEVAQAPLVETPRQELPRLSLSHPSPTGSSKTDRRALCGSQRCAEGSTDTSYTCYKRTTHNCGSGVDV
jgi:hypothetical protein